MEWSEGHGKLVRVYPESVVISPEELPTPSATNRNLSKRNHMSYKELTPENLTPNQAKYFQPSKALPYKDYIIENSLQGMTPSEIHRKLLKEFPKSQDVTLSSLKRVVKRFKPKAKAKINYGQSEAKFNKSKEIRKFVKELIHNNVKLNATNIANALTNRGIMVQYSHVVMAIGQGIINGEFPLSKTPKTNPKIIKQSPHIGISRRQVSERLAAIHDLVVEEIRDMQAILQDEART